MDNCKNTINMNPCDILDSYIKKNNGNVGYAQCHIYLNNKTDLTQIQINNCLNKYFPNALNNTQDKWAGII